MNVAGYRRRAFHPLARQCCFTSRWRARARTRNAVRHTPAHVSVSRSLSRCPFVSTPVRVVTVVPVSLRTRLHVSFASMLTHGGDSSDSTSPRDQQCVRRLVCVSPGIAARFCYGVSLALGWIVRVETIRYRRRWTRVPRGAAGTCDA